MFIFLIEDTGPNVIADSVQSIAGRTAQEYNQRKDRQGALCAQPYGVRSLFLLFCCVGAVPEKACRQQLTSGMRQALLWGSHLDLWS